MYGQDHLNEFVDEQYHVANVKNIENMLKAYSGINKSILFKSTESTLHGFTTVLLSRLSSSLVYKKNWRTPRPPIFLIN